MPFAARTACRFNLRHFTGQMLPHRAPATPLVFGRCCLNFSFGRDFIYTKADAALMTSLCLMRAHYQRRSLRPRRHFADHRGHDATNA